VCARVGVWACACVCVCVCAHACVCACHITSQPMHHQVSSAPGTATPTAPPSPTHPKASGLSLRAAQPPQMLGESTVLVLCRRGCTHCMGFVRGLTVVSLRLASVRAEEGTPSSSAVAVLLAAKSPTKAQIVAQRAALEKQVSERASESVSHRVYQTYATFSVSHRAWRPLAVRHTRHTCMCLACILQGGACAYQRQQLEVELTKLGDSMS
jgi:hypothetical protein